MHSNEISFDSMMMMDNKIYARDVVIDCKGNGLRNEIRLRNEDDKRIVKERTDFNYYNLENYIEFIKFFEDDPNMQKRMIEYAQNNSAFEIENVDCSQIWEILARAYHEDQAVRSGDRSKGSMGEVDRTNMIQFVSIVEKCGFDAIKEQGTETVNNAWFIVQHGHKQLREKYVDDFMECTEEGLLEFKTMALMIDRMLVDNDKPQIYGSQFGYAAKTGKQVMSPIEDMDRMIHLRDSLGLMPIEAYAEKLGGVIER